MEPKRVQMETTKLQKRHDRISVALFFATIPLGVVPMYWGFDQKFGSLLDVNRWLCLTLLFYFPLIVPSYFIVKASDRYAARHGLLRLGSFMKGLLTLFQPMFLLFGIFGGIPGVNASLDRSVPEPFIMMVMERFPQAETTTSGRCYHLRTYPKGEELEGERICEQELADVGSGAKVWRKARQGFLGIRWLESGSEFYSEPAAGSRH